MPVVPAINRSVQSIDDLLCTNMSALSSPVARGYGSHSIDERQLLVVTTHTKTSMHDKECTPAILFKLTHFIFLPFCILQV